jgi:hypothetical protein
MARVAKLKNLNEYLLLLAGDVAEKLIRIKLEDYSNTGSDIKPPHPFTDLIPLYQEGDNRIANRAYTMLENAGALTTFTSHRPNDYSWSGRKERMRYSGRVSEEWFNKYAKSIMVAPTFETSGVKIPDESASYGERNKKVMHDLDNYRKIFNDAEYAYIWFHMDEYDVRTVKEEHSSSRYGRSSTTYKLIYPKALLQDLSKGVFKGHAEFYVERHIQWAMKYMLGIENDRVINGKLSSPATPDISIDKYLEWNELFVAEQLKRITNLQTYLGTCKTSFERLKEAVRVYGGWDLLKEQSRTAIIAYLENSFPLHMGDDEPDEELRKLCQEVATGKNKGFNERLQVIQSGGKQCTQSPEEI